MGAGVGDPAGVQDHDPVGQVQRGPAVRDDQRGPALHHRAQGGVDLGLQARVDGRGRVVEHQQPGVGDHRGPPVGQGHAAGQLETVIVTAQRRSENIKDVPMSIARTRATGRTLTAMAVVIASNLRKEFSGDPLFEQAFWVEPEERSAEVKAAMDAVSQWRYRPYMLNGDPYEVETQGTVNFVLN